MKRDESRDVAVVWDWDYDEMSDKMHHFPGDECLIWGHPEQSPRAERYVPLAQLETEREVLRDVKREAKEIIKRLSAVVIGDCSGCRHDERNSSGACYECARAMIDRYEVKP